MSDPKTQDDTTPADQPPSAAVTPDSPVSSDATPESAAAGAGEIGADQLKAIIATLQSDLDSQKNQMLRLIADMDNLRKRTEREKEEAAKYAITKFARDLVVVADNFERAIAAVPQGAAEQDPALESLVEGVSMTERELVSVLEKHGVTRISPMGEPFSPHFHQAMMEVQNPDVAPNTVMQVFQPGYLIDDRVLRPAMVVVAKGGAKPVKAESVSQDTIAEPDNDSTGSGPA